MVGCALSGCGATTEHMPYRPAARNRAVWRRDGTPAHWIGCALTPSPAGASRVASPARATRRDSVLAAGRAVGFDYSRPQPRQDDSGVPDTGPRRCERRRGWAATRQAFPRRTRDGTRDTACAQPVDSGHEKARHPEGMTGLLGSESGRNRTFNLWIKSPSGPLAPSEAPSQEGPGRGGKGPGPVTHP